MNNEFDWFGWICIVMLGVFVVCFFLSMSKLSQGYHQAKQKYQIEAVNSP